MAPPRVDGNTTRVNFHLTVMSLDSIDESSMTYVVDVFFAQSWKDGRLRLPDNMTSEYRLLPVSWLKEIWHPDSFFKNAKRVTFHDMTIPNHYIWLYKDKTILYMVKLSLLLSCPMNFQNYPHDTQQCALKIESLSHTTDDLVFAWEDETPLVVDRIELPQLDLVENATGDCTHVYSTGNFTCLEVVFKFKRRLGYYLFHTYVPTCLIVIMSWISFWIRPEAVPARVTLGVTSLLTLSTQHANSQKSLPPVSYIKAIDVFMSSCTVFVFLSLMEYALVNIIIGDLTDLPTQESFLIRSIRSLTSKLNGSKRKERKDHGQIFENHEQETQLKGSDPSHSSTAQIQITKRGTCVTSRSSQSNSAMQIIVSPVPVSQRKKQNDFNMKNKALLIDQFSRMFFPVCFFLFNLGYWTVFVICAIPV
ncbi:glycine receptor subunit alpha-2-like isoform X2 [Artemia franciscana]|nr:hypothetical protein QYM36_007816 [Artemia franciscana]